MKEKIWWIILIIIGIAWAFFILNPFWGGGGSVWERAEGGGPCDPPESPECF